jgi:methylated-DNA-[protein]-cysteine S-methyltransferase
MYLHTTYYNSPLGLIKIVGSDIAICAVSFVEVVDEPENPVDILEDCKAQLQQYFAGTLKIFSLAIAAEGTVFQQQVWQQVQQIPFGNTCSYGDIALQLQNETASRAVGAANGQNPIAIIIPCHRVIAKNGDLTGYAWGMQRKHWLLAHEQKFAKGIQTLF